MDDPALLKRYAETRDESAFAQLVQRHLGLVYHTALRRLNGDGHHAHDVSQTVFTLLAHKAAKLTSHPTLTGWLHTTTVNIARELIRSEQRRTHREQQTHVMQETSMPRDEFWQQLRPVIDDALNELNTTDRNALLLRYFEDRSLAHVAATFRLTEDAARMRVNRALEKLRGALIKRGITSTAAGLAVALPPYASTSIPTGVALNISSAALSAAALPAAGSFGLFFIKLMTIPKTTACLAVISLAATLTAIHQTKALHRSERAATERDHLARHVEELTTRTRAAETRAQEAERDNETLLQATETLAKKMSDQSSSSTPLPRQAIDARFRKAQELARSRQYEAALTEFLWCFDVGMKQDRSYAAVRTSMLRHLAEIGKEYPPALAALNERRQAATTRFTKDSSDFEALSEIAAINRAVGEDQGTLELFDSLSPDDKNRTAIAHYVADKLIEARRYHDLVKATPYSRMNLMFEITTGRIDAVPESARASVKERAVSSATKNLEVLAGAGDAEHARQLLAKILAFDGSKETKALVEKHLIRAGHPELLAP